MDLEVSRKKKSGRPKKTWMRQVEVETENWFEEGRYPESSKVERLSASNCRRNGLNPAISAKGTIPKKN